MEQSIHNLASPKPDNGIGTVDTPRTSNLKFLRAKRLSYFCGKSVQSHLSNTEETKCVGIQKNQQHTVAQTPRRSCSAPTSKREQSVSLACNAHKRANLKANISSPDEAIHLQGAEETSTIEPATPQILQRNPGKESTSELPGHHSVPSENEGKTKDSTNRNNLRKAPEKSWANKSIHDSLQQAPAKSNPLEASTQHSLQPAPKEKTTEALIHYSLQPSLGKAGSKVISTHPILQPEEKETTIMEFPTCSNPQYKPEKARTKDSFTQNHLKPGPGKAERNIPSTHRSLLRSSFVSDLDQDLLEDLSVPETEKLQHVMTWAKKFLNKSNGRDNLPVRESDDLLPNNMDERSVTDKYCKSNSASADSSAQYDVRVESNDYGFKKQPYLNDQCKESAPITFWVPKSPRNKFKTNSVFNQVSRATPEPDLFLSKMPVSTVSHSDHKADKDHFNKPLQIMHPQVGTNRLYKDPFRNKSSTHLIEQFVDCNESVCSDDEDIYRNGFKSNQWDCNIEASKVSESDIDKKDNFTDRVDDTSSTESSLDTERLNALLDNLGIIHKGSEKKTSSVEKDGSRTDRTFLVEKCAESVDGSAMSASIEVLDWSQPHSYRVCSNMCLSEDSTTKVYQVCPACSFFNTKITSWCSECGSFLDSDKGRALRNDTDKKFQKSPTSHQSVLEDFFSVKKDIVKGLDKIPVSKQNDKECGRTVCWEEDNSDVVSDGGGSVLEKYLLYVQQLDLIRKEKEEQNKYEEECFDDMSSEDESSKEYSKPQLNHNITKTNVTNTRATSDYDNTATQFLENPNCLAKSDLCRCDQQSRIENHLTASTEKSYETEASNLKGALDRKLQKATHISSKVTGPKRYWEKSSLAWSSYTHGELKPRSHFGNQRPASAELRKKSIQGDKAIGAVSEHLCQSYWDGPSNNLQWISKGDYGSMWLLLPDELWIYIFAQLSHRDLSKVTQVCQRFRYIANDDSLWKVIRITNRHSLNDTCLVNIGLHHPESLSLYRCHDDSQNITEEGLRKLFQHCKDSLRELNVTNCSGQRFEGDTVLFNASNYCTRLTSVDISWTAATDKGIIALVEASAHLQSLSVNGCKITDHAITALLKKHCESLIKIEVFGCHTLSAKCLISMATACTHLENLNIGRIPKVTDDCLAKIASNLRKISTLNLTGVNVVRDRAVHHIVKQCSKLDNLTLSSCSQVTDVSLVEISTYLRTIKYLDLSGCKKVSDIGIQALARSCQQIRYLDLSSTGTGKRGVCLLASYCYATLECLKLSFCKEVTADAIEKLCKNCKRLKMLHLYGCRVSPDFENIKKFSKSFQIFHDLSIPTAKILGE